MTAILDFLLNLQNVSLKDWSMMRLSFGLGGSTLGWMIFGAVVLGLLGWWSYRIQSTSPRKQLIMGVLRGAVLCLMVLLFCRPQLVIDQELRTPSIVAVWVDNSASMSLRDPYEDDAAMRGLVQQVGLRAKNPEVQRPSRWDLALDALEQAKGNWLHKLAEKQEVAILSGSGRAQLIGIARHPDQIDALLKQVRALTPSGELTDVPTVTAEVFRALQGQPISAVVLMTDGRSTEATRLDTATNLARQNFASFFALPLGQATAPLNLAISEPRIPENTFVKDPVSVKAKVTVTGLKAPRTITVNAYRRNADGKAGELLKSQEITLDPEHPSKDVDMVIKPEKAERMDLLIKADGIGEELTLADNQVAGSTTVLEAKVRVLYVEGQPRWEYRYLKNELKREKTVDVSVLLLSADENFAQEGNTPITRFPETPEELANYDVILLGDVDPLYFSPAQRKLMVDFVAKKGGGLGVIAGTLFMPDAYKGSDLEPLLPVVVDDPNLPVLSKAPNEPFNLRLTAAGRESAIFRFFDEPDDNLKQIREFAPMYWYKPVLGPKGAAEVLAVHPEKTVGSQPVPLIVVGRYGAGRTLYSGVADTWRWRLYTGEPLFQSYWLQMVRLLYRNKALGQSKRIELALESNSVEVGKPIRLSALVLDPTLTSQMPTNIPVQLVDSNGRTVETVTMTRLANAPEQYQGVGSAGQVGAFRLTVLPGALPVEVPAVEFEVRLPDREFSNPTADMEAMQVLAVGSKGQVISLPQAEKLGELVPDRAVMAPLRVAEELWNKPLALILLVALLTAEWIVRKSAGLV